MRKSATSGFGTAAVPSSPGSWLDVEDLATAEICSEEMVRISQSIRRIHLQFREALLERSRESALCATSSMSPTKELVRQQWAFSPNGAQEEVEHYFFDLKDVTAIGDKSGQT